MRKIHKLLLPIIIFMSATIQVKAQKENIIPNGGYEEWRDGGQPMAYSKRL